MKNSHPSSPDPAQPDSLPAPLRWLLLIAGFFFTALAFLGVFLPLLPTTPFLLIAAAAFLRSSPPFYNWLNDHPQLGPYLRNYREHKAMTRGHKIFVLALLWLTMGLSIIFFINSLILKLLLIAIGSAVTLHLLLLKTMSDTETQPVPTPRESKDNPET